MHCCLERGGYCNIPTNWCCWPIEGGGGGSHHRGSACFHMSTKNPYLYSSPNLYCTCICTTIFSNLLFTLSYPTLCSNPLCFSFSLTFAFILSFFPLYVLVLFPSYYVCLLFLICASSLTSSPIMFSYIFTSSFTHSSFFHSSDTYCAPLYINKFNIKRTSSPALMTRLPSCPLFYHHISFIPFSKLFSCYFLPRRLCLEIPFSFPPILPLYTL